MSGYIALLLHIKGTINGRPADLTGVTVYQVHSNVLSGVYAFGGSLAKRRRVCLHAAEQSAYNLTHS